MAVAVERGETAGVGAEKTKDEEWGSVTRRKVVVKAGDMEKAMVSEAVRLADEAMEQSSVEMDIARHIKRGFDAKYPPPWHAVVGRKFGSYVTHETGHFTYFFIAHLAVLLFKSKD